jgi:hypothetical protein
MLMDFEKLASNVLTLDGIVFKTSGNILFSDSEEGSYYLAQNSRLEKIEGLTENGMNTLMKKTG